MTMHRPLKFLIVIVFALSACTQKTSDLGTKSQQTPAPAPTKAPVVAAYPATGNPEEDLKAVFTRFGKVKAFRVNGLESTIQMSYVAPDRYSIESSVVTAIIIGKNAYIKSGDTWSKANNDLAASDMKEINEVFSEKTFNGLKEIKFAGVAYVGNNDTYVYTFKGFRKTIDSDYDAKLWVNKEDGLPIKLEYSYPKAKSSTNIYTYSDITIEPPM